MAIFEVISRLSRQAQHWGEGNPYTIGRLFLGIALWNTFSGAVAVLLWPQVYEPAMLVYLTPTSILLPIGICLGLACTDRNLGIVPVLKVLTVMVLVALVVFLSWTPHTEAWLNIHGQHLL